MIGSFAGSDVTTGCKNVMIGHQAGTGTTSTGCGNILIGPDADTAAGSDLFSIFIGNANAGKGTNTAFIDPNGGAVFAGNNSANFSTTSDRRIKKNIVDNNVGLDKINQIQIKNFEYRTIDEITDFGECKRSAVVKKEGLQIGVIAQEIEQILPDLVREESTGVKTVDPSILTWYLINGVKELSEENKDLKSRIEALESN